MCYLNSSWGHDTLIGIEELEVNNILLPRHLKLVGKDIQETK